MSIGELRLAIIEIENFPWSHKLKYQDQRKRRKKKKEKEKSFRTTHRVSLLETARGGSSGKAVS